MNYTLNQLKVFHKVVETNSITKAADALFMTQPAVSIQLKNFQQQFEVPLTELSGRKIKITDFGLEIATMIEKILEQLNDIQYKTKKYKGLLTGKLKIACASTGKYVLPYFLSQFMENHKGIDVAIDVDNKTKVLELLKNKDVDLAVVSVVPKGIEVGEEFLLENKLYLIDNMIPQKKQKALIFREKGSATRQEMESYFKKNDSRDLERLELSSNEAVKQAIIAGMGRSILPLIGIKNELLDKSLQIIPRKNLPIITKWRIIWLKNKKITPVAAAYLDFVKQEKAKILKENFQWYLDF